jgi:hypothetical protein
MPTSKSLVYVDERGLKSLQHAQDQIKKAANSKELTKKLNAKIRTSAQPIATDMKTAAKGLEFVSTSRKGGSRANRNARQLKTGKWKRGRSLREEMSFGIKVQVRKGASSAGVRIVENNPKTEVNRIARAFNSKGQVRHPLFGNKNHWYMTKTKNGKGWFDKAGAHQLPRVTEDVKRVVNSFTNDLARKVK